MDLYPDPLFVQDLNLNLNFIKLYLVDDDYEFEFVLK